MSVSSRLLAVKVKENSKKVELLVEMQSIEQLNNTIAEFMRTTSDEDMKHDLSYQFTRNAEQYHNLKRDYYNLHQCDCAQEEALGEHCSTFYNNHGQCEFCVLIGDFEDIL